MSTGKIDTPLCEFVKSFANFYKMLFNLHTNQIRFNLFDYLIDNNIKKRIL